MMNILDKIRNRFFGPDLRHPATIMSFNKLYKGLMNRADLGLINVQRGLGLEIFSYSKSCVYEGTWDKFSLAARGLILDPKNKKIIALPFPKFFNYGEVSTQLPDLPFTVTEKMDGSLGIVFYWQGKWHVATKGSFISDQSQWATKWLIGNLYVKCLHREKTYLTEIIYPSNKIVVSYDFEGLVLLGGYDLKSGLEDFDLGKTWLTCDMDDTRKPKVYTYDSLDDMIEVAETLDVNEEGFVVRFSNGYRIKIKGAEYCRVHRLISNCTPLAIWDMMRNLDDLEVIRVDLPEEHRRDFDLIRSLLQNTFDAYIVDIETLFYATKAWTDREVGLNLKSLNGHSKVAKSFLFAARKKNFLKEVYEAPNTVKHARRALFEKFRPTGNILEGFTPSSVMDRFEEEI